MSNDKTKFKQRGSYEGKTCCPFIKAGHRLIMKFAIYLQTIKEGEWTAYFGRFAPYLLLPCLRF